MLDFYQDTRFGMRHLRRSPAFTAVLIFTLALGIGASTAVFSLIDAAVLRVAPYPNPGQLVFVFTPVPKLLSSMEGMFASLGEEMNFIAFTPSPGDFNDIHTQSHSFSGFAIFDNEQANLSGNRGAERVIDTRVTGDFFPLFRVAPELGRTITPQDARAGAEPVVVISHAFWQSYFAADRSVVGKTVDINSKPYRVVGVTPRSFEFPFDGDLDITTHKQRATQVWLPWMMTAKDFTSYDENCSGGVARLAPGITLSEAQQEVSAILARTTNRRDAMIRDEQALLQPFAPLLNVPNRRPLLLLTAAVALVLLIACSNAAGLLMARAAGRLHEFGVRAALGAKRSRLVRQLLTESALIAVAATSLGILIAYGALRLVVAFNPGNIPRLDEARINTPVLAFGIALALVSTLFFGLLPAISTSRINLGGLIQRTANRTAKGAARRVHESLILLEVALCVILLAGSGLFIRSLIYAVSSEKGFQPHALLAVRISLDDRYSKPQQQSEFLKQTLSQIQKLPEVVSAAATSGAPLDWGEFLTIFKIEDHPFDPKASFEGRSVGPGYFATLGIPVLEGREFTESDLENPQHFSVVNRTFAHTYFPDGALGKHFWHVNLDGTPTDRPPITIIGVVPDVRQFALDRMPGLQYYGLLRDSSSFAIVARTRVRPAIVIPRIREVVRSVDPQVPLAGANTMDDLITAASAVRRFQAVILAGFAAIALLLSIVGLYALMAHSVRQCMSEIGIRMALGAQPSDVLRMILSRGLSLTAFGAVLGLAAGAAVSRLISRFLFGVRALDPLTIVSTIALLVFVCLLACLVPAIRAANSDPMIALRHE